MKYIFINGPGRSGTTLMKSLLDSHRNLIVFPVEVTNYFKLFMGASHGKPRAKMFELNRILLRHFGRGSYGGFYPTGSGLALNLKCINPAIFDSEIRKLSNIVCSPSDYLRYIQKAYLSALRPDVLPLGEKVAFVLKTADPDIEAYLEHFEDSQVIFMIRHPMNCFNSKKKFYSKRLDFRLRTKYVTSIVSIQQIKESFKNAEKYSLNPRVMIIKLEDLQNNPSEITKHITEFIGIEFHETLLFPTVLGKKYPGNTLTKAEGCKIHNNLSSSSDRSLITKYEDFIIQNYIPSQGLYKKNESSIGKDKKLRFGLDFLIFFPEEKKFWSQLFKRLFKKGESHFLVHFFGYLVMGFLSSLHYYLAYRIKLYKLITSCKNNVLWRKRSNY